MCLCHKFCNFNVRFYGFEKMICLGKNVVYEFYKHFYKNLPNTINSYQFIFFFISLSCLGLSFNCMFLIFKVICGFEKMIWFERRK